ncbi:MAG: DUF5722 domain-containing protein [Alistipes sp.]|nr:DUF5722 domain-containing protein [Alistipes sp.]
MKKMDLMRHVRQRLSFGRTILSALMIATVMCSCGKDGDNADPAPTPDPDPTPDPTPVVTYMTMNTTTASGMKITKISDYRYEINTTNADPYIQSEKLTTALGKDSVVLTFDYQSSADQSFLQLFFSPIDEARSIKAAGLVKSTGWKTYSLNLQTQLTQFSWGKVGQYIRWDFGDASGIKMQIRNIRFRGMTDKEKQEAQEEQDKLAKDKRMATELKDYLAKSFASKITSVKVSSTKITVQGTCSGAGSFSLCEVTPYDDVTEISKFDASRRTALTSASFTQNLDRFVTLDGVKYDRLLSKWVIVRDGDTSDELVSHAHYADNIEASQSLPKMKPTSKKGLGGFFVNAYESDLDDLGITSATVNVTLAGYMSLTAGGNTYAHEYCGKTYYFNKSAIDGLDNTLRTLQKRNIVVAAIILIQKASDINAQIGKLLQHPDYVSAGIYSMPNMTEAASVQCYAAGLDFLAKRYCQTGSPNGRIHNWIMHNEVDAGYDWTNMGAGRPMEVYTDTYMKSMRMCYNIARQYDENAEVFGSFTHSWNSPAGSAALYYSTRSMLGMIVKYSAAEGDFHWGVAAHPYPQDLNEPKTWNDTDAKFMMSTPLVTFKNLEVLDKWIKKSENMFNGNEKRSLWLSENGTNSRSYTKTHLEEQAAGFAYAWKKISQLDGIDGIQWHNWIDNRVEYGLRIGLRRFPDDETDPAGKKDVWYAYQAAGTDKEETFFEKYLSIIGITNWDSILQKFILDN